MAYLCFMPIENEPLESTAPGAPLPRSYEPTERQHGLSPEIKEILEFTERENQKHRDYFQMLYKWTSGALAIIVLTVGVLVAFVGWHTVEDIRKQAQSATDQEISNIRKQSRDTLEHQTLEIQRQITEKLNNEFRSDAIRQTVQSAARQQTAGALLPIITTEVRSQVGASVKSEQQTVQRKMLEQVHQSVEDLKPTINKRVDESVSQSVSVAVRSQVDNQVTPLIRQLQDNAQVSTLINQAESDDGTSFDTLLRMAADPQVPKNVRDIALKVVKSQIATHNSALYTSRTFTDPKTRAQLVAYLQDPDSFSRQAAIDSLGRDYWKSNLDQLFTFMMSDPSLDVRMSASVMFTSITQMKSYRLDNYTESQWWNFHRKEFVK